MAVAVAVLASGGAASGHPPHDPYASLRAEMVATEIAAAGIERHDVLESLRTTPRHEFVPPGYRAQAYFDAALPIGAQQTISPPYVVAYMTQALDPQPTDRVLEIGSGSGYQAAVLSPLVQEVYTIEIVAQLGQRAERTLARLGYDNVHLKVGDGFQGWPEHAPFDKIIVTCSPEDIPQPLVDQLAEGGQMIIPVGERYQQNLWRITKQGGELVRKPLQATLFVPMTGVAEAQREVLPDPAAPSLFNGGFELCVGDSALPQGWHYLRRAEVVAHDAERESAGKFLRFRADQAGEAARALQGLALDGRQVSLLEVSCRVRGSALRAGPTPGHRPSLIVTFYDARRAAMASAELAGWEGTFSWQTETAAAPVPLACREAIVRIGLLGGTGELDLDDLALRASMPQSQRKVRSR